MSDKHKVTLEHQAKQSREIKRLKAKVSQLTAVYDAARHLCYGVDWNNGTMALTHGYRKKLVDAVHAVSALPAKTFRGGESDE